jgi:hypothetical protein
VRRKNKSKGKTQKAKVKDRTQSAKERKVKREWPMVPPALTFAFCTLPFDFALGS